VSTSIQVQADNTSVYPLKIYENFDFKNPNYKKIIQHRITILEKLKNNTELLKSVMKHYSMNPADFIQDWGMTYDPRNASKKNIPTSMPFILFPKQREFIEFIHESVEIEEDGIGEKSRDAGLSWCAVGYTAWSFLFVPGSSTGWGSRTASLVDTSGAMDSIFEKIRYFLKYIPDIFYPRFKDDKGVYRKFSVVKDAYRMKIVNGLGGASITGEGGDEIGRGGRKTLYIVDESASLENQEATDAALSQNTNVRIDISTPKGVGNSFHKRRISGSVRVFTIHWKDDPRKDEAWYEKQKEKYDAVIVAQEIDINYEASVNNICIPHKWIMSAVDFIPNPSGVTTVGFDVAYDGTDTNVRATMIGMSITELDEWDRDESDGDTAVSTRRVYQYCKLNNVEYINFDAIGVGAGASSEFKRLDAQEKYYKPTITGVKVSETPSDGHFKETDHLKKDMLLNLRAELWWDARTRFEKTYEHVNGIKVHPLDELISIPNDIELIRELSTPKFEIQTSGKIKIESKEQMRKRGVKSPNKADAVLLCLAPKETFDLGMF
jgi:hypothetical protein